MSAYARTGLRPKTRRSSAQATSRGPSRLPKRATGSSRGCLNAKAAPRASATGADGHAAGHEVADGLDGEIGGTPGADDAPAEEHHEAIGESAQLVEVLRDQQHGGAGLPRRQPRAAGGGR